MASFHCPTPSNINPLSPNGFLFVVTKIPEVTFFCQQINIPGMILGEPEFSNPFSKQPIPGDSITFDTLNMQFLIDEEMKNFTALYDWMVGLGFPENYTQYQELVGSRAEAKSDLLKNYSDATLIILGSNNMPVKEIQFKDAFPISLESLTFSVTNTDVNYLVGNVQFRFGYYKIV